MDSSAWRSQPFFVINDEAYARMLRKLRSGSSVEYTYAGVCPHNRHQCRCPKMANVLRNGRIVRLVDGEEKPVYSLSEFSAGRE